MTTPQPHVHADKIRKTKADAIAYRDAYRAAALETAK